MTDNDVLEDFPQFLPEVEEDLRSYLICPERLPMHKLENVQEFWERKPNIMKLLHYDITPASTTLKVQRDYDSGEIIGFKEVAITNAGENSSNSLSFTRAPSDVLGSVKGNPLYLPFWPGTFVKPDPTETHKADFDHENLLRTAPGVSGGLLFADDNSTVIGRASKDDIPMKATLPDNNINLADLIKEEEAKLGIWKSEKEELENWKEDKEENKLNVDNVDAESLIPKEVSLPVINTSRTKATKLGTEFVVVLDCSKPITNFHELIPDMAHQYPFELDTFQKQAIIQLEKHNHVFVAAHTSAGKTVVAEYAIALCERHMTRAIYTSPIKALSNQKYRDFKQTFSDVGLITGDFQINPTASCLIMTTEILRSMLYCGSEVTRDIEYVIFDEVHYINDEERGHVWEQVLIMLPERVCVVLLSATVPNEIEFADWLGRTHQRKVYVVSTTHRPVPLEHYLYTGTGGSSKHNRYLILDSSGWKKSGYEQAKLAVSKKSKVFQKYSLKQEETMWYSLMDHLRQQDLLPIVVFKFSRAKCDSNAQNLHKLDLTTQSEKNTIGRFFEKCIRSLKEPDRNIPQIIRLRDIFKRGIGVHHSGILPIIKEIVEMLFQNRLIKLLFATETFAMGVNMPSRTVIFDSITKHDGREMRHLLPAEYIQMAGRAGRRGKDKKGTVIILCKREVPDEITLQDMMLGRPSQLVSKFRITYGMVLSLLRVESLTVEGMMSRSFREADHQKSMVLMKEQLEKINTQFKEQYANELSSYLEPLISFYQKSRRYLDCRKNCFGDIICSGKSLKEIAPGKILLVSHMKYINKLALVLSHSKKLPFTFRVLILTDDIENITSDDDKKTDLWYKMISLSQDWIYCPSGSPGHEVLTITPTDIFQICNRKIKIDANTVLKDWDKRQIPRFKNDIPGPTFRTAVEELYKLSVQVKDETKLDPSLKYMHLIRDIGISDQQMYENILLLEALKEQVDEQTVSLQIPNFEKQFAAVYERKVLEDERDYLRHMLSDASMALYPDYESRIQLLRDLKYVDAQNRVELKGRVACEIGVNELLVTELILRNILTKLKPAEVAALLSSLVFQAKTEKKEEDLQLTEDLKTGIEEIKKISSEIEELEMQHMVCSDFKDLNFGLLEVVYEWASNKPFADIMTLTDVQEGIIVRCIQQLNEIICDVKNAARLIGEPALQNKMEEASNAIKRDIVFAASLYTQRETSVLQP